MHVVCLFTHLICSLYYFISFLFRLSSSSIKSCFESQTHGGSLSRKNLKGKNVREIFTLDCKYKQIGAWELWLRKISLRKEKQTLGWSITEGGFTELVDAQLQGTSKMLQPILAEK